MKYIVSYLAAQRGLEWFDYQVCPRVGDSMKQRGNATIRFHSSLCAVAGAVDAFKDGVALPGTRRRRRLPATVW